MACFSAKERRVQPETQATPLAEDWLSFLQSQLRGGPAPQFRGREPGESRMKYGVQKGMWGEDPTKQAQGWLDQAAFGGGIGPLQREAGTAARQYLEMGGGPEFQFDPLVGQLTDIFRRETERGAAQVREGMGTLGQRFGTPLAREEGRFRRESETDFLANLGEMFRRSFESRQERYAQMIPTMFGMGTQALAPFERMAGMGILPEQISYEPQPWMQAIDWAASLFGGGGAFGGGGGGGGGGDGGFQWSLPVPTGTPV